MLVKLIRKYAIFCSVLTSGSVVLTALHLRQKSPNKVHCLVTWLTMLHHPAQCQWRQPAAVQAQPLRPLAPLRLSRLLTQHKPQHHFPWRGRMGGENHLRYMHSVLIPYCYCPFLSHFFYAYPGGSCQYVIEAMRGPSLYRQNDFFPFRSNFAGSLPLA